MSQQITLRRGLDLRLQGALPAGERPRKVEVARFAVCPEDFPGFQPKVEVHEGDTVLCGTPLLHDKSCDDIKLVSPVAGRVEAVERGERRRILRVVVAAGSTDGAVEYAGMPADAGQARQLLMGSGLWAMMRQLPYDIVPESGRTPRDIFVTAFDSAPLAPSLTDMVGGRRDDLAAGVKVLSMLTDGKIYLGVPAGAGLSIDGAETVSFKGPHPAGNPSVQAGAIAPVNKGETVWMLDIATLARIGRVALTGRPDWSATVALTGSELDTPTLVETLAGASLGDLIKGNLKNDGLHKRVISGNVLTGRAVGADGFLRWPYRQVTVIPEGDDRDEFMGWASLSPSKMSSSASFPSRFMPWKRFAPDARLLGGRRAMIMSGLYEKMLPMDIMAEYLIKAIIARDIDKMEALGIYEVTPADFALCEYIDPSKLELQRLVREGLNYMRRETE